MSYKSIDTLQRELTANVFHYANDPKKAAGRALGTLIEVVTFYLLKSWGYERNVAIERRLPEYANTDITHNVEFSLHPSTEIAAADAGESELPLTSKKIHKLLNSPMWDSEGFKPNQLISRDKLLRNGCTLHEDNDRIIIARLVEVADGRYRLSVHRLLQHPFALMECKRVGVEEGVNKGPQTIEKAKQGAYVARSVSSLQKIRMKDGTIYGILHSDTGELLYDRYSDFLLRIIRSDEKSLLADFTLTVGIVSNHGNWFTAEDQNKEIKVLAESYDWLLFLTDAGLAEFVQTLIVQPKKKYQTIRSAFIMSYGGTAKTNRFTKVRMELSADLALREYFIDNLPNIERWFNVISPSGATISELRNNLNVLALKSWEDILNDCG